MGVAGQRPTLSIVKEVTGKKGKGVNTEEPKFDVVIPKCPMKLDAIGKKEWDEVSLLLFNAGVLTEADKRALAIYCRIWSQVVLLSGQLNTAADYIDDGDINPLAMRLEKLMSEHRAYSALLGLDPLSRTRIKASPPQQPKKDGKERFFK
jgi:P27 family predicted phage terminase small subunit